ncbi:MAG TPA: response regulator, partial [Acetobacteraceae bacterium]
MMAVTVLLVEDDELVRCVMVELLKEEGFEVYEAHDGDLAALFINNQPAFDVLLTDVNMPGTMDGWDLADHARGHRPSLPVIVVSGRANNIARWQKL